MRQLRTQVAAADNPSAQATLAALRIEAWAAGQETGAGCGACDGAGAGAGRATASRRSTT
jgi:hypothetical protein